jgi:transcriptional accessory protein Tex/SPT6
MARKVNNITKEEKNQELSAANELLKLALNSAKQEIEEAKKQIANTELALTQTRDALAQTHDHNAMLLSALQEATRFTEKVKNAALRNRERQGADIRAN